ncbi:fibronectin type III domain-containing protein [Aquimarina pacifica]|uniref:hypothetical protein n=1 Tax=Aquimarina pacifica TaxID=1296415 RepID=UPI0004B5F53F|nr:hypothetical protein [Aquimarina pacifica]
MNRYLVQAILIILISFSSVAYAQQPIGDEEPEVKVISVATKDAIKLRWGVTTPLAWKYANQYGYVIERKTIAIGDEILKEPIVKRLTVTPILPKPMMEWENFVDGNDNAAIAAQALYGEDFAVDMEEGGNALMQIINKAKVLEQRFSFALFAADQDYKVAEYSGLAYVDTDVKPNERYLYRVYTAIPEERIKVKFGGVYTGLSEYRPLPKPQEFIGIFKDKHALLSWNYKLLKREYTSYIIERSVDGTSFAKLNDRPLVNLNDKDEKSSERIFYIDSLPQNDKTYYYRIKGISPFGEVGPTSEVISGVGKAPLLHNPGIIEARLLPDNRSAVISWEFPEEGIETLDHFELFRSDMVNGKYTAVRSDIPKASRTITVTQLNTINYFSITAVGKDGSRRKSFPQMIQPVDDTPPAVPFGLIGTIDSTGVVQLQWQMNTEKDFLGYRVFRANLENEEFTQITIKPTPQNRFIDTIKIKNLNPKVYYKIQSFDKRYNPSNFSEVLTLVKPDVVPPTQPVFESFNAENGVIELTWITSSSVDAAKTLIYRKEKGAETSWALIADINIPETKHRDTSVQSGITYLYTLVTIDESGLESEPITPLTIRSAKQTINPEIDKFDGLVNRDEKRIILQWKYKEGEINEFLLYRAEEDEKPTLYKVFTDQEEKFIDNNLKVNTHYTYLLKAVLDSGTSSPIKKIEINY